MKIIKKVYENNITIYNDTNLYDKNDSIIKPKKVYFKNQKNLRY